MGKGTNVAKIISIIVSALLTIVGLTLMVLSVLPISAPIFVMGWVIYNTVIDYVAEGAEWLLLLLILGSPLLLGCLALGITMFFYGILAIIIAIIILAGTFVITKIIEAKKVGVENKKENQTDTLEFRDD